MARKATANPSPAAAASSSRAAAPTTAALMPTAAPKGQDHSQPCCQTALALWRLTNGLVNSVPEATASDKTAVFARHPSHYDNGLTKSKDLWQLTINGMLKDILGWHTDLRGDEIVKQGKYGVGRLAGFVDYFVVERGVPKALFEGKLSVLMDAMREL